MKAQKMSFQTVESTEITYGSLGPNPGALNQPFGSARASLRNGLEAENGEQHGVKCGKRSKGMCVGLRQGLQVAETACVEFLREVQIQG